MQEIKNLLKLTRNFQGYECLELPKKKPKKYFEIPEFKSQDFDIDLFCIKPGLKLPIFEIEPYKCENPCALDGCNLILKRLKKHSLFETEIKNQQIKFQK